MEDEEGSLKRSPLVVAPSGVLFRYALTGTLLHFASLETIGSRLLPLPPQGQTLLKLLAMT